MEEKNIRDFILDQVKNIVLNELKSQHVKVYLFGSWARGKERRSSDIDVAIWSEHEIPFVALMNIRFQLEESTIPYRVDVVDLTKANVALYEKVKKEGIIWKDYKNE